MRSLPDCWARPITPPVLENWGLLWIYHSIALLVFFGATNWLYLAGVTDRWPYFLIFTVGLCGWAAIFWALRRRGGPIRFVERQLAHVWGAGIVAINLVFLVEWLLGLPVLALAPMIAVTNGMLFMIKGGILSGGYYLQAASDLPGDLPHGSIPSLRTDDLWRHRLGLLLRDGHEVPAPPPAVALNRGAGGTERAPCCERL